MVSQRCLVVCCLLKFLPQKPPPLFQQHLAVLHALSSRSYPAMSVVCAASVCVAVFVVVRVAVRVAAMHALSSRSYPAMIVICLAMCVAVRVAARVVDSVF